MDTADRPPHPRLLPPLWALLVLAALVLGAGGVHVAVADGGRAGAAPDEVVLRAKRRTEAPSSAAVMRRGTDSERRQDRSVDPPPAVLAAAVASAVLVLRRVAGRASHRPPARVPTRTQDARAPPLLALA